MHDKSLRPAWYGRLTAGKGRGKLSRCRASDGRAA
jgi:hypothetical protein